MNYPINWDDDGQIRKLFSFQTRVGIAPKFGTMPIAYYQADHCKSYDLIMSAIRAKFPELFVTGAPAPEFEVKTSGAFLYARPSSKSEMHNWTTMGRKREFDGWK